MSSNPILAMKNVLTVTFLCLFTGASAQEMFVFSEPASNIPSRSLEVKQSAKLQDDMHTGHFQQRHTTELMFGLGKDWMLHLSGTFSNMYSPQLQWESQKAYIKYRFLAKDGVYSHFRMAAFIEGAYSRNVSSFDELNIDGDQSGMQAGIIVTQLLHKLAISSTIGLVESLQQGRWDKSVPKIYPYEALNYSFSAGYLLFPKEYADYQQLNVNLYAELIGQNSLDMSKHFTDLAPGLQFIFHSQAKLSAGYRFQLNGNMNRMSNEGFQISFDWLFLNVLK